MVVYFPLNFKLYFRKFLFMDDFQVEEKGINNDLAFRMLARKHQMHAIDEYCDKVNYINMEAFLNSFAL